MRYFGSKASTLDVLASSIGPPATAHRSTFCDPFAGLGVVGSRFKELGYSVTSGDVLTFAHHFQTARLVLSQQPEFRSLESRTQGVDPLSFLNAATPVRSWVYREFSVKRHFFTPRNGAKIDAVRRILDRWRREGALSPVQEAYLYAALVDSADRVANTAGTYYAHLKGWTRRALNDFVIRPLVPAPGPPAKAILADALDVARIAKWDVLYLDPPYNDRDHSRYYHFPETLATGRPPYASGASGVPRSKLARKSRFCTRSSADALQELLRTSSFRRLVVHYSDAGLISQEQLRQILSDYGRVSEEQITASGYRTTAGSRSVMHRLYTVV